MENNQLLLKKNYDEMIKYVESLEFDGAEHEIHSKQVEAWAKRHPNYNKKENAEDK